VAAPPAAAPSTPAPPPAAAQADDEPSNFLATNWPWMTVVVLLLIGGLIWMKRGR
jgi:hypothetical protein